MYEFLVACQVASPWQFFVGLVQWASSFWHKVGGLMWFLCDRGFHGLISFAMNCVSFLRPVCSPVVSRVMFSLSMWSSSPHFTICVLISRCFAPFMKGWGSLSSHVVFCYYIVLSHTRRRQFRIQYCSAINFCLHQMCILNLHVVSIFLHIYCPRDYVVCTADLKRCFVGPLFFTCTVVYCILSAHHISLPQLRYRCWALLIRVYHNVLRVDMTSYYGIMSL